MPDPLERVARALCRADGNPENTMFEGKPMWTSYLRDASIVMVALALEPLTSILREVALEESVPQGLRTKAQNCLKHYVGKD